MHWPMNLKKMVYKLVMTLLICGFLQSACTVEKSDFDIYHSSLFDHSQNFLVSTSFKSDCHLLYQCVLKYNNINLFNLYSVGTKSDQPLSPLSSQAKLTCTSFQSDQIDFIVNT